MNGKVPIWICALCVAIAMACLSISLIYAKKQRDSEIAFSLLLSKMIESRSLVDNLMKQSEYFAKSLDERNAQLTISMENVKSMINGIGELTTLINLQKELLLSSGVKLTGQDKLISDKMMKSVEVRLKNIKSISEDQ